MSQTSKSKYQVSIRGGFSDRNGFKPESKLIQYNSLDIRTRTLIINRINLIYHAIYQDDFEYSSRNSFWLDVMENAFNQEVDYSEREPYNESEMFNIINNVIRTEDFDTVLTLLEFLLNRLEDDLQNRHLNFDISKVINSLFKEEYVGYRFLNGQIIPITDKTELDSIQEALSTPFSQATEHLDKALKFLSDRQAPDYANSIKESISAVEAICSIIVGKSDTLSAALKKLEQNNVIIHPVLKIAFDKLFAYTSDAKGIRHAGNLDGPDATFDEAKFMLVSCSAFVNYLKGMMSTINNNI